MDGGTVVGVYIGILCAVFDYERNVKNFFKKFPCQRPNFSFEITAIG